MRRSGVSVPALGSVSASSSSSTTAHLERVPARVAALRLGVKVGTLAKWRYLKKGPKGWVRISATCVVYPTIEISRFLEEKAGLNGGEK
jgi:hypothetical protein